MSQKLEPGTFDYALRTFKEKLIPGIHNTNRELLSNEDVLELIRHFWYDGYTMGYSYGYDEGYDDK